MVQFLDNSVYMSAMVLPQRRARSDVSNQHVQRLVESLDAVDVGQWTARRTGEQGTTERHGSIHRLYNTRL